MITVDNNNPFKWRTMAIGEFQWVVGMRIVVNETFETLDALKDHHVRGLTADQKSLLMARAVGASTDELADDFSKAPASIRRDLEKAEDPIFVPLGLSRSPEGTGFWVACHLQCCLRRAQSSA